ncbi:MAG TPA: hypothetical protein VFY29_06565 [Terriglobia bacterium]|nr:hypothetical protein [Terriglobia bacterium]
MKTRVWSGILAIAAALVSAQPGVAALTPDEVRGGWIADLDGERHILLLNVRGSGIDGIYCRDCANPENLAFVVEGKLAEDAFSLTLLHDAGAGAPYRESVKGRIVDGRLVLSVQRQGSNPSAKQMTMMREPRRPSSGLVLPGAIAPMPAGVAAPPAPAPAPVAPARGGGRGGAGGVAVPGGGGTNTPAPVPVPGGLPAGARGGRGAYVPPGPNETLTPARVVGLWLWGTGPGKQYFMFREVAGGIRGMVCGPCDNPFTFGVLSNGVIDGEVFRFNIVHEDWGIGIQNGPFNNQATATISMNEMHIATRQDNQPATSATLDMTLLGPVRLTPAGK